MLRKLSALLAAVLLAVTVVAIGVVLGGGGTAVAKKPTKARATPDATIQATTFKVADRQEGEEYAKCPANERVVGGDVVQSGPQTKGLYVDASGPLDETGTTAQTQNGDIATQWYAAVGNYSGVNGPGGPVTFKVFAICSAKSDATIEATSFQVPENRLADASAVCPPNKRALGGGVVESGPLDFMAVQASGPLDETGTTAQTQSGDIATQWYAAVRNYDAQNPLTFEVSAICQ